MVYQNSLNHCNARRPYAYHWIHQHYCGLSKKDLFVIICEEKGIGFPVQITTTSIREYKIPTDRHSFEMYGTAPACLLLHGFTGDPREMRILADRIHAKFGFYIH